MKAQDALQAKAPRRRPILGFVTVAVVALLGGACGFVIAVLMTPRPESPSSRTLTAAYLASTSDRRPRGFSARSQAAATMWDARNAEGFRWAASMGVADRRDCPGDHGPFRAGCLEEADDRSAHLIKR